MGRVGPSITKQEHAGQFSVHFFRQCIKLQLSLVVPLATYVQKCTWVLHLFSIFMTMFDRIICILV